MSTESFKITPYSINDRLLVVLPQPLSDSLSSRAMVFVKGTLNGHEFAAVLEPDGRGGHWFEIDETLRKASATQEGSEATLTLEQSKDWPEPTVPDDIRKALAEDAEAQALWDDITPVAHWDWIRWVRATASAETRSHRIEVALSKMKHGERRPCCFNRAMCTDPSVSKSGMLLTAAS